MLEHRFFKMTMPGWCLKMIGVQILKERMKKVEVSEHQHIFLSLLQYLHSDHFKVPSWHCHLKKPAL